MVQKVKTTTNPKMDDKSKASDAAKKEAAVEKPKSTPKRKRPSRAKKKSKVIKEKLPLPKLATLVAKENKRLLKTLKTPTKERPADPSKTHYTKEELEEFKAIIDKKLDAAKQELQYLQEQITRKGATGSGVSDARFRSLDDGAGTMEREQLNQHAARQVKYIGHLESALMRISNGTYGICRDTGLLIAAERLRIVPHATLSIEAKRGQT